MDRRYHDPTTWEVVYTKKQIRDRVRGLAKEVGSALLESGIPGPAVVVGILEGGAIPVAGLISHLPGVSVQFRLIKASSYNDDTTRGNVIIAPTFDWAEVKGRHVVLVDDIIDSGFTMATLYRRFLDAGAARVTTVAFLQRRGAQEVDVPVDYVGFSFSGDDWLVGYGLDWAGNYRHLPNIVKVPPELVEEVRRQSDLMAASPS